MDGECQQLAICVCVGEIPKSRHQLSHYDSEFNDGCEEKEEDEEVGGVMCPNLEGDSSDGDEVAEDGDDHNDDVKDAEGDGPTCLQPGLDVKLIILHRPNHLHSFFVPFSASTSSPGSVV